MFQPIERVRGPNQLTAFAHGGTAFLGRHFGIVSFQGPCKTFVSEDLLA
jgi:hypothetical protein